MCFVCRREWYKMAKMSKEEFRKKVKDLGYQIRFRKVNFEGSPYHIPSITKNGEKINDGNVFTKEFFEEHKEVLQLVDNNSIFPID